MTTEDEGLADAPILTPWQIVGGAGSQPELIGVHAFHEGERTVARKLFVTKKAISALQAASRTGEGPDLSTDERVHPAVDFSTSTQ